MVFRFVNNLLLSMLFAASLYGSVLGDCPLGDLDRNCRIDFSDVRVLARQWLIDANQPADFSGNGVNNVDFSMLANNWRVAGESLVISEFMVSNASAAPLTQGEILDEDGESSDWIEIHNPTSKAVELNGWYLTDDPNELDQWQFPAVSIARGEYKVVFASGKNRRDPDSELHTNFQLKASRESLLLVFPDGQTVAHGYENYAPGYVHISYGIGYNEGTIIETTLVAEYAPARALIPVDAAEGLDWTEVEFDDSAWKAGTTGVGYDTGGEYDYLLNLNVAEMRNVNETVYVRVAFQLAETPDFDKLVLYMKRDDGFAAYLNGNLMPEASALADTGDLNWNSGATGNCSDAAAHVFEEHDITKYKHLLQAGDNILAVHGLNQDPGSSDLLILPKLTAEKFEPSGSTSVREGYFLEPSPGKVNGGAMRNLGPVVHDVTEDPPRPAFGEDIPVTARVRRTVDDIRAATLHYRVMYNSEDTLPMYDD
ncbi:MAG: lamin tail domain-containing protein, partial [Planctomycetota bacterium]